MSANDMLKGINELIQHNDINSDELKHWGTKGMKWGVRRYQNKDGTLTAAGKKRYDKLSDDDKREFERKGREKLDDKIAKTQDRYDQATAKYSSATSRSKVKKYYTEQQEASRELADLKSIRSVSEGRSEDLDFESAKTFVKKNMEDTGTPDYDPTTTKKNRDDKEKHFADKGLDTTKLKALRVDREKAEKDFADSIDNASLTDTQRRLLFKERQRLKDEYNAEVEKLYGDAAIADRHAAIIAERATEAGTATATPATATATPATATPATAAPATATAAPKTTSTTPAPTPSKKKPSGDEIAYYDSDGKPVLQKDVDRRKALKDTIKAENEYDDAVAKYKKNHPSEEMKKRKQTEDNLDAAAKGLDGTSKVASSGKSIAELVARTQKGKMDVDKKAEMDAMSDTELQKKINRIRLEQQYADLNPSESAVRAQKAANILEGLGYAATLSSNVASTTSGILKIFDNFKD